MSGLEGRVVLVTGAAGALGRAVVEAFARAGAKCAALDIDQARLREAFGADTVNSMTLAADLRDGAAIEGAVKKVTGAWGRIDALCNIAGGFQMGPPVHETTDAMWTHMMDLNAGSVLRVARAVVPVMLKQGGGKIVNIGAMGGVTGRPNMTAYSASKSAVIRLTEGMSAELRDKGVNVNCVLPSIIDTPANRADMPKANFAKWVAPAALADVIVFLASDAARAVHGAALPVVGLS
jgi:NAD(P)-dependent dehydrogenase (short-subunit alcohol dehydrogenase family)